MFNKKLKKHEDTTLFLDQYDDQYLEIKDALELQESTDSETTDISDFRVVNSKNPYPSGDLTNNSNSSIKVSNRKFK